MADEQKDMQEASSTDAESVHLDVQESAGCTGENCDLCQQKIADYKAGWQRAVADYQNLQRETQDKRTEWARMSEWQVLEEVIPVYDNFKKAFAHQPSEGDKQWQNWAQGIGYIMKQFAEILKQHHIDEIPTAGHLFDPFRHEAVGEEESTEPEGTILREVDAGYMMDGKILKVAKVVVARHHE